MRNISGKICRENENTHLLCLITFFFENRAVYEITLKKNTVEPDNPQMTIWLMRIACWIPKSTNKHSEHELLIDFHLQQWLQESF